MAHHRSWRVDGNLIRCVTLLRVSFLSEGEESYSLIFFPAMNLIYACTTCAKAFHAIGGNAAGFAILFLLVVIVAVLGSVGFFMGRMMKREENNLESCYKDDFTPSNSH